MRRALGTAYSSVLVAYAHMASSGTGSRVKWISDLDKNVLTTNFEKRGWVKGSSEGKAPWKPGKGYFITLACLVVDGDWNFYW